MEEVLPIRDECSLNSAFRHLKLSGRPHESGDPYAVKDEVKKIEVQNLA
jgi:hypothetical protein